MRTISNRQAKTTDMVYMPHWDIDYMTSCCGARVIRRLGATYQRGEPDKNTNERGRSLALSEFASTVNDGDGWGGTSYVTSLDIAFTAVLQDMRDHQGRQNLLFLATDNVRPDRRGDVHEGPFATRYFVKWLEDNKLAEVTTSARCGNVEGYTIKLIRRSAGAKARRGLREYNRLRGKYTGDADLQVRSSLGRWVL